ncbi:CBS domain-containing protein [Natronoarchaeum mannanilyticum]|uniref:CBS domain-containing protein n=1 Tax=Natronoarchaeum mannanilyticum TaxID=926360 RepID=A0AAV3TG36_9EURY
MTTDDIFVGRLMSTPVETVTPDTLVEDAADRMLTNEIGSLVVVGENNDLLGILTTTDFVDIVAKSKPKAETTVERYMSTDVTTAEAGDSIQDVADQMVEHGFHHMPVVDDEEGVIGMITTTDMAAYLSNTEVPAPV